MKIELEKLRLIGLTGSTTSTTEAPLILLEGEEADVREEEVVVVDNRGSLIFAVCRQGLGINENLRVGGYSPGVAYVRSTGKPPSTAKESYHFILSFIGVFTDEGLKTNDSIVAPGSPVYLFRGSGVNPFDYLKPSECVMGGYLASAKKKGEEWQIPFDKTFIPYHIGVFGATGSGKSRLARHVLIPLLKKAGYGVLVLDWEGVDYTPFFKQESISICDFRMDAYAAADFVVRSADYFGYDNEEKPVPQAVIHVMSRDMGDGEKWWDKISINAKNGGELREKLRVEVLERLKKRDTKNQYMAIWEFKFESGLEKIMDEDWELLYRFASGKTSVEDFRLPSQGEVCVIDMSEVSDELKLSFFSKLCSKILSTMQKLRDKKLRLALIIDEAPQYCPFEPRGLRVKTTEQIKNLCALGRKRELCVVLLAQGMAGEIGINAAVRRNLNTLFIGQIHPLDLEEAGKRLAPYGIKPEKLLYLNPGEFYFTGKINPLPTPLLISFKID